MASADAYVATEVAAGCWSDTVTYAPAVGGQPASVVAGSLNTDAAQLDGTVRQAGDVVTVTLTVAGAPFQIQLAAVCDIAGGTVLTDGYGGYFLFASAPLRLGASYAAVAGFGQFAGGATEPACFAAGTRLQTRRGPVAVEALRVGDRLRTLPGGTFAPVVWTGWRRVDCAAAADPSRLWPVRVLAGAFGPGMPRRDVRLSPDHAVFVDGLLVPVRYLVNEASIAVEPVAEVTYWHVELPTHAVVLAEGLPAESYLDTGNRGGFRSAGMSLAAPGVALDPWEVWRTRACAPLALDPAVHGPIRLRMRARAGALGFRETADAALQICRAIGPLATAWDGQQASVRIPAGARRLRLCSRFATPCAQHAAGGDDRRLGVAVRALRLDGRPIPLDDAALGDGWHGLEDGFRWTDGDAGLALAPARTARTLEVLTAPMLRYWLPRAAPPAGEAIAA